MSTLWHRLYIKKICIFLNLAILFSASLLGSPAYAISRNDLNSILYNTPFYDPNASCTADDTGVTTLTGDDQLHKIFNFFVSNGFTPPQAAGIAGNVERESNGDPEISQLDGKDHQDPPQPDNINIGWGIVQWSPARKILSGAASLSQPAYLLSTQLQFLLAQLNGTSSVSNEKPAGDQLKQVTAGITTTSAPKGYHAGPQSIAWHAAQVFLQYYERAADHAPEGLNAYIRGGWADKLLAKYGAGSTVLTSGATAETSAAPTCGAGIGVAGKCDTPAPTGGYDVTKSVLLSKFKIILIGVNDADWATQTYNTMCALAKAPAYFSRLMAAGPINVDLISDGSCGAGYAESSTLLHVHGPCSAKVPEWNRMVLSHELGHLFAMRNGNVFAEFDKRLWGGADIGGLPGPSSPPTLPTLNCQHDYDNNGGHGPYGGECWADMIGEYLVWFDLRYIPSDPPGTPDFKQYATQYSAYYDFARDNLFGGVEYNSL